MGGGFLVWPGVSLSLRRFRSWQTRKDTHAPGVAIGKRPELKTVREAA